MIPVIFALPFDPTGSLARNRVLREYHSLSNQAGLKYRTLVLDNGYFYTEGVEIEDSAGFVLEVDKDFQCIGLSTDVDAMKTGKEICSVIVILNPRVTQDIFVNASMVGGKFCKVSPSIADMSAGLLNPTRNPTYKNIAGKPDEFEVGGHLHAMWELYGFEDFVESVDRITTAKAAQSATTYNNTVASYQSTMDVLGVQFDDLLNQLAIHINAANPHAVTKAQVGLSDVQNYPIVSSTEATTRGFNSNQRYLTVQRFKQMIDTNFVTDLTTHINRTDNPHKVTVAQAGTYTIQQSEGFLDQRLDLNATAVSTYKLEGYDYPALYNHTRTNLNANNITQGVVNIQRIVDSTWPGGFCARLVGTCYGIATGGNAFLYEPISYNPVTIDAGDKLVYDIWVDTGVNAGIDAVWGPGTMADALRFAGLVDQNGVTSHPAAPEIPNLAGRQWYTRTISLTPVAGRTLIKWNLAVENDTLGTFTVYVREVRVVNAAGQIKAWIFNASTGVRSTSIASNLNQGYTGLKYIGDGSNAPMPYTGGHAVVGNNQVINLGTMINMYAKKGTKMVYLSGANGVNIAGTLASTYSNSITYPAGTLALVMIYYGGSWGYGNASESRSLWRLRCWVKVNNTDWQAL